MALRTIEVKYDTTEGSEGHCEQIVPHALGQQGCMLPGEGYVNDQTL